MRLQNEKIAKMGMLLALGIIFGYLEFCIPISFGIPGIKLGLPNLLAVVLLYRFSVKEAALYNILRIILTGMMFGSLFSVFYSLAGAVCSLMIMYLCKKFQAFDMVGVSMLGGVFHNLGQIAVAMVLISKFSFLYYLPFLLISGLIAGFCMGQLSNIIYKRGIL